MTNVIETQEIEAQWKEIKSNQYQEIRQGVNGSGTTVFLLFTLQIKPKKTIHIATFNTESEAIANLRQ